MSSLTVLSDKTDYADIVDHVDELFAGAFYTSDVKIDEDSLLRFWMMVVLLRGFGKCSLGIDHDDARKRIGAALGSDLKVVEESSEEVASIVSRVVEPTYIAASYWSPIDHQRHTFTITQTIKDDDQRKRTLAYAYAFYALTHAGMAQDLYSAVQYLSTIATHKRSLCACYKDTLDVDEPEQWWHIPERVHEIILKDTGIVDIVKQTLLNRTTEELQNLLRLSLVNIESERWIDLDSFAASFVDTFHSMEEKVSEETRSVVNAARRFLGRRFGNGISFRQALFMVMTHVLYRTACPANYVYSLPVRVAGTCCVMTMGCNEQIPTLNYVSLSRIVASVFTHPLLLDYAAQEANARFQSERNAMWERTSLTAAHRIYNPIFEIGIMLDNIRDDVSHNSLEDALKSIESAKTSVDELRRIVYDFRRLAKIHNLNRLPTLLMPLIEDVRELAERNGFQCDFACPEGTIVLGDIARLGECLKELMENAIRWCTGPTKLVWLKVSEVPAKEVPPSLASNREYILIRFADNGPGIPDDLKKSVFDEFFTKHPKGTGLGLTFVKRIVEYHDGTILVDNQIAAGAEFAIYLPKPSN